MNKNSSYSVMSKAMLFGATGLGMLVLLIMSLFIFIRPQRYAARFDTLKKMQEYAHSVNEYPKNDAINWINPDYSSYYRSLVPSILSKILTRFGLKKGPGWSLGSFGYIVRAVTQAREAHMLTGVCARVIMPKDGHRFFIWTDLQGSLHSLVRCLEQLHNEGVIDEQLKIKEGCHFIFNGNLFAHGPFVLQTLTMVLWIMHINPNQVFMVRNYHEQPQGWYDQQPASMLRILARTEHAPTIPYAETIDAFLNTLPDVFYISREQDDAYQSVEIAYAPHAEDIFTRSCSHAMIVDEEKTKIVSYDQRGLMNDKSLGVRAIIIHPDEEQRSIISSGYYAGLMPGGINKGVFEWFNFSSPNGRSHQLYQFYYDVIVELRTTGPVDQWTISETRNDVRDTHFFEFFGNYYVVNGRRSDDAQRIETLERQIEKVKKELEEAKKKCAEGAA